MKKALKKSIKRDQILLSAVAVITRNGFNHTTMEDISRELQMTKGSLYYYFKNKEDLMYQCHKLVLSSAIKELEELVTTIDSGEELLRKMVDVHIEYAIEEKEIFNLILEPKFAYKQEQLDPVLKLRKYYSNIFDRAIEKGKASEEFSVDDPVLVRMMILGAMNWIQQWFQPKGNLSKDEIKQKYGDYIIKLLK